MISPIRLTVVMTHPVQYTAAWFRHIASRHPEIDLTVLYATLPTPEQQGVGFGRALTWDAPLTEGYRNRVVRAARPRGDVGSERFLGVDVPEIAGAIRESRPDVALVPGWHSITLLRAILACRRAGIPVLYRGDTHLGTAPSGLRYGPWAARTWFLLRRFAGYLAVGNRAQTYLRAFGVNPARIFASPHCVDNDFFAGGAAPHGTPEGRAAARASFGLGDREFAIAFVGKLEAKKRPLDLVRAAQRLGPGVRVLIVGAGALEAPARSEAGRLGVAASFVGFLNQSELGRAYAAADCLALPSDWGESWGLVVNEALATGLPAVVSDRVGGAPDLIVPRVTGEVFACGDVTAFAAALGRVWELRRAGHDWAAACRARAAAHSLDRAAEGLVAACRAVTSAPERRGLVSGRSGGPRVLACCGDMVVVAGRERQTFEVLRTLRERGAEVQCIVNRWENHRIVALAEEISAGWSTGHYATTFDRHTRRPRQWAAYGWDIARTSWGLLRDARRFGATHVLVPSFDTALRNAPGLMLLRALGRPVVLRVANHPGPGRFHRAIWARVLPPLVTRFVANSDFGAERALAAGVPRAKVATIRNAVARRMVATDADADVIALARGRRTVLCVGQIAPFKGTHLAVEATLALLARGDDVHAIIVGRAPQWPPDLVGYLDRLRKRVEAAGAGERIHFVGERDNVLAIMREAYVLVAPILQEETFGNVVLEAMSVGLPVVAFATGGVVELVEHGVTGYLCREPTLPSLLEGLDYFLADGERRDKAAEASLAASSAAAVESARPPSAHAGGRCSRSSPRDLWTAGL